MTDLRELLIEAAPRATAAPSLERLHALASDRRRRRRIITWCAGMAAVLGLAVPGGSLVLNPTSDGVNVDMDGAEARRVVRHRATEPEAHPTREPDSSGGGRLQPRVAPTDAVVDQQPSVSGQPATIASSGSGPAGGGASSAPSDEGCALPEPPGTDRDEGSCSYVASQPGGYVGSGSWTLLIIRNGQELRYSSLASPSCAATGFVHPGDEVHANLGAGAGNGGGGLFAVPQHSTLHVGPGMSCE